MPEPVTITLAAVGMVTISEGIKFLYGQANELIKWLREKRKAGATQHQRPELAPLPAAFEPSAALAGLNEAALEQMGQDMDAICDKLSGVITGRTEIDPNDSQLMGRVDALRLALEAVTGQRLTFSGERRSDSQGPAIRGQVAVGGVAGYVAGVVAGKIKFSRTVDGYVKADVVEQTGIVIGTHVDEA